jgi:hypothetical protein
MSSEVLHLVALIRPYFGEHIASNFRVIGIHGCFTVESMSVSLPIEGYYVGRKNAVCFSGGNNDECFLGYYTAWL